MELVWIPIIELVELIMFIPVVHANHRMQHGSDVLGQMIMHPKIHYSQLNVKTTISWFRIVMVLTNALHMLQTILVSLYQAQLTTLVQLVLTTCY